MSLTIKDFLDRDTQKPLHAWEKAHIQFMFYEFNDRQLCWLKKHRATYVQARDHPNDTCNIKFWQAMDSLTLHWLIELSSNNWNRWRRVKRRYYTRFLKKALVMWWDEWTKSKQSLKKLKYSKAVPTPPPTPACSHAMSPMGVFSIDTVCVAVI
ncbi:hypothetical protein Moror_10164 [Moniliophthora roreri MCA 2997]|uniref:Uncharacterized protein n=2 Tax=Moniliophthora roreri TaxID=221103 RepID=V2WW01_MONRO|nr:hypothetical protein Moror_10164 [Moniliophthora roreri MCA 2997]